MSTVMFNIFINDLIGDIELLNIGIDIDGEKLSILLYADDIVLLAENAEDLQKLLDVLKVWCNHNSLKVNLRKSMHLRNPSVARSDFQFSVNDENIYRLSLIISTRLIFSLEPVRRKREMQSS